MTTFTPEALAPFTEELGNPQRGAQYTGDESPPPDWPLTDTYKRWCWSEIEPQEGQYQFSLIDQQLAAAKVAGYTFGFRIMPVNPSEGGSCIPQYLMKLLPKGFTENGIYIPDYNDPQYLARAQALFTALGQRYNHDPRLGWLDMSLYGCWGEWNDSCVTYPSPTGAVPMTAANRQALINMQAQAFADKRFLMLTGQQDSLDYALSLQRTYPIGIRIDCLGSASLGGARDSLDSNAGELDRWRTAPVYFEYCGNPDLQQAYNDIKTYHASIIGDGDGNLHSFQSYSVLSQSLLKQSFQVSGYRYVLDSLSLSSSLAAGQPFSVITRWSNTNVAPTYHPWNVMIQLRDPTGHIVWQEVSKTNLQTLLPTSDANGRDTPVTITDQFTLPANLSKGSYTLSVQVIDPTGYYRPLKLAIQGVQPDGSYTLGTVKVA